MKTIETAIKHDSVENAEGLDVPRVEPESNNEAVSAERQALTRINGIVKNAERIESASPEISLIDKLGGEIGNRMLEIDQEIITVQDGAIEEIEHVREYHELYHLLDNSMNVSELNLQLLQSQTEKLRGSQRKFNSVFDEVIKTNNKKEIVPSVDKILEKIPVQDLTAGQAASVFNSYKRAGDFQKMVDVYNQSESTVFKKSPVIRELLAVALNKVSLLDEGEEVAKSLIEEGKGNGEIYAILGKIYKLKHDRLRSENPEEAAGYLKQSVDCLENGFKNGFEFYPGINLVYNKITEGSNEKDIGKIRKALKTAELVYISTQKAGGMNSADYWTLATTLESSLMTGRESETALNKVIENANVEWEINAPIENLERLKNQIGSLNDGGFDGTISNVDNALTKLRERLAEINDGVTHEAKTDQKIESGDKIEATDYIFSNGFNYGEISSFVGGNIEYGGQLHSHVVNRWDIAVGREFLAKAELGNVTSFDEFNAKIDVLIRQRYGTAPLENLHSQEHKDFDDFMKKFNGVLNVGKGDDSRTNIMADFWLGKGDCRQHAYTKQLFFDIWKTDNINRVLKDSYDSLESGNDAAFSDGIAKAKSLVNSQMFVFDSIVVAPIQMEKKYLPTEDESGRKLFRADGIPNEIEDHTWNGLVELDDDGKVKNFTKTDSFYQNEYKFGGGTETSIEEIVAKGFSGGEYEVFDPVTNKTVSVEVKLVPTPYAGNREKRMKSRSDDLGLPLLRGLAIDGFPMSKNKIDIDSFFDKETNAGIKAFVDKIVKEGSVKGNTLQDALV